MQIYSFQALRDEILVVLSAIAHASSENPTDAQRAFAQGTQLLKNLEGTPSLFPPESCSPAQLDPALNRLATAAGPIKQRVLLACATATSADGVLRVSEAELLRAFAACLDCPMPPLS